MNNEMTENSIAEQELPLEGAHLTTNGEEKKQKYRRTLISTLVMLVVSVAAAFLLATQLMPVLQIYGSSMNPTLWDRDTVVAVKDKTPARGDVVAFNLNNKILVKRVIGVGGDRIDVLEDGTVLVNGEQLEETYITAKVDGDPDITLPYQVPEDSYFVMGDHREKSVDSRHTVVGCVTKEQLIGKPVLRIWPWDEIGFLK